MKGPFALRVAPVVASKFVQPFTPPTQVPFGGSVRGWTLQEPCVLSIKHKMGKATDDSLTFIFIFPREASLRETNRQ